MCPIELKRLLPSEARGHNPDGRKSHDGCCGGVVEKDTASNELAKDLRVTIYDLKFSFVAPRAGNYALEVHAAVDCYHGCSKKVLLNMVVKEEGAKPPPPEPVRYFDTDDEPISSSEEESTDEEEDGASETESEYEYIEVTDDGESEDSESEDDIIDITGPKVNGISDSSNASCNQKK